MDSHLFESFALNGQIFTPLMTKKTVAIHLAKRYHESRYLQAQYYSQLQTLLCFYVFTKT